MNSDNEKNIGLHTSLESHDQVEINTVLEPSNETIKDSEIGTLPSLMQVRQEQNISSETIASSLRLSNQQVIALEQRRWSALPAAAYVKGFLRSYCKLLNIDPQPYLQQYAIELEAAHVKPQIVQATHLAAQVARPAQDIAPPQALGSFDNADEVQAQRKQLIQIAGIILLVTSLFLLYWERDVWIKPIAHSWQQHQAEAALAQAKQLEQQLAIDKAKSELALAQEAAKAEQLKQEQAIASVALKDSTNQVAAEPIYEARSTLPQKQAESLVGNQNVALKQEAPTVQTPAVGKSGQNTATASQTPPKAATAQAPTIKPNVNVSTATETKPTLVKDNSTPANKPNNTPLATDSNSGKPAAIVKENAPQSVNPTSVNSRSLDIQFVSPVWLELRDKSGAVIMTGMYKANTASKIRAEPPLQLVVGAAQAVKVKVDGQALDLAPHSSGGVAKVKIQ